MAAGPPLHDPPVSPPTTPDSSPYDLPLSEQPSKWPTVIGIIAIVLASFGLLGAVCVFGSMFVPGMGFNPAMMPGGPGPANSSVDMAEWADIMQFNNAVGGVMSLAFSVLEMIGGILLLERRRIAVSWLKAFAWLTIMLSIGFQIWSWSSGMMQQMMEFNAAIAGPGGRYAVIGGIGGVVCATVFGLAFPVFLLIWFSRSKVKAEVSTWR